MNTRPEKIPGPDHPISISRNGGRVAVRVAGQTVAVTHAALRLEEASIARHPAFYPGRVDSIEDEM